MGRRDLPRESVDERTETSPATEILEGEGLSMGKEVKIGLGVIVVLLVIFGGVLYYRLSGPPSEVVATAENEPKEPAGEVTVASDETTSASKPTVITATAGSDSGKPKLSVSDMAQWNTKPKGPRPPDRSPETRPALTPPSYMPQTGAKSHLSDPFHRQTVSVEVDTGKPSDGAVPPAPSPTVVAYGNAAASTSSTNQNQAGEADAASSQNPLRSLSPGATAGTGRVPPAPLVRDSYDQPASRSPLQVAAAPAPESGTIPPRPMHGRDFHSGRGYQAAQESPAYGSPYNTPPTRVGMSEGRSPYGTGSTYGAGATYGGNNPYGGNASYNGTTYDTRGTTATQSRPGQPPASASAPAIDNTGKYLIQPNDSYWTISERLYGSGAYFQALAEHNREKFPDENRLKAGEEIVTPTVAQLEKSYPGLCPKPEHRDTAKRHMSVVSSQARLSGRVYVVQEGDTLFDIARYELGKAARWAEIYELNREAIGTDFDHLSPGMQLILPKDPSPGKVTQRSEDLFQR